MSCRAGWLYHFDENPDPTIPRLAMILKIMVVIRLSCTWVWGWMIGTSYVTTINNIQTKCTPRVSISLG